MLRNDQKLELLVSLLREIETETSNLVGCGARCRCIRCRIASTLDLVDEHRVRPPARMITGWTQFPAQGA